MTKGWALVPVGATNQDQRPPVPALWAADKEAFGPGCWNQPGLKGGISPGWIHEPGPMPFVYIQHLEVFAKIHLFLLAPTLLLLVAVAAEPCPDAVRLVDLAVAVAEPLP